MGYYNFSRTKNKNKTLFNYDFNELLVKVCDVDLYMITL